ncbi:MAG TPA: NAD/NADP octopine/nopaline dehydrogenase family protein [Anaerolineae bacterium]|nr:NAD/NADP octopine/nopaline dehydrogenase family protein [Anaerolineae bacterium]HQI84398.1 NAD/NADP octopine/nopaline dehydrogenase family protein [Anaerolineae bacterium]
MEQKVTRVAVLGAGHGGKAMAAEMASRGFQVTLYNRTYARIEGVDMRGAIELQTEDGRNVVAPLHKITADMGEALQDVELVMVVVPASGHRDIALSAAPYLNSAHVVVLHPGRTGGALEFMQALVEGGCNCKPIICEAETFLFAARSNGPAEARIFRTKFSVPVAAFPATRTQEGLALLTQVYPQFVSAKNVLYTSLNNMGAIFHPALTLLSAGWIEARQGDFEFYMDGVTPATSRVLAALDRERVTVASAVGIRAQTAEEWLERAYGAVGGNLYEAMHANPGYGGIKAPNRIQHRYIFEDVPCSLVPIALIGQQYGVDTTCIRSIINLGNIVHGTDYWRTGRTLERLGIKGISVSELHHYVETGER